MPARRACTRRQAASLRHGLNRSLTLTLQHPCRVMVGIRARAEAEVGREERSGRMQRGRRWTSGLLMLPASAAHDDLTFWHRPWVRHRESRIRVVSQHHVGSLVAISGHLACRLPLGRYGYANLYETAFRRACSMRLRASSELRMRGVPSDNHRRAERSQSHSTKGDTTSGTMRPT